MQKVKFINLANLMKAYQLDNTNVATEIFDNEAVLINIPQGKYYSVRGNTSIRILEIMQEPSSIENILGTVQNEFELANDGSSVSEIEGFIKQLENENVIIPAAEATTFKIEENAIKHPYEKPELEIFDDMQELIMLDPVHDVESFKGWPQKKEEVAND